MLQGQNQRRRSVAWIYYALLTILSVVLVPSVGFSMLLGAALFGLYATYLYRGGRFVLWIW